MSFKLFFNRIGRNLSFSRTFASNATDARDFVVVYRLPQIFVGSIINKIKKIQLYATGTIIPASYGAFLGNFCDMDLAMTITTVGFASTIGIFSVGQLFTRTIGFVYLSKDGEKVKISYIDFWGGRKDIIINTEEILPLSHSPRYFTDRLYRKIFITNTVKPLKLVTKMGEVADDEGFRYAFSLNDDESVLD